MPTSANSPALAGTISGIQAWSTFWVVESAFIAVLHTLHPKPDDFRLPDPHFPELALLAYLTAGALAATAIAVLLRRIRYGSSAETLALAGPVSLALVFLIHIRAFGGWRVQLFVAILLVGILLMNLRRKGIPPSLAAAANAWFISFTVLVYPFALAESHGRAVGRWMGALGILLVFLISYLSVRLSARFGWSQRVSWGLVGAAVCATVIAYHVSAQQRVIHGDTNRAMTVSAPRRPNIVLITLDTVRADHLSLYGYSRDTSPNLQQFAREANVFTHAIAASDMTLASHASIFTGLYPSEHGAHWQLGKGANGVSIGPEFALSLPSNSRTLASILAGKGYRTLGIAANVPYMQHGFHLDQGFQYFSLPVPRTFLDITCDYCLRAHFAHAIAPFFPPDEVLYVRAGEVTREAFGLLDQQAGTQQPFLLFLNYMDAHQPYFPPAPYDVKYPGKDSAMTAARYWPIEFEALSGARQYTDQDRRRDESQYDGAVAYIDAKLGELFARMKQLGLYDNSMIIVTSDHGQSFGEKGLVGHGSSVYQEQVHVPLIVKYPGTARGDVRDALVSHVDLLPTILETVGIEAHGLPGRSLRAASRPQSEAVYSESFPCDLLVSLSVRFRRVERAAFVGSLKLITATNAPSEFYDLSADPHEERNLYKDRSTAADALETRLHEWESSMPVAHAQPAVLDKRALQALKSLGYLQ